MTSSDFEPGIAPQDLDALRELSLRLSHSRPLPSPAFRGALGRAILDRPPRPSWVRLRILSCLASGTTLLLVATLGVNGVGPLAPGSSFAGATMAASEPQESGP
jgi:hypothetical protein